jgi:hypothetical protein
LVALADPPDGRPLQVHFGRNLPNASALVPRQQDAGPTCDTLGQIAIPEKLL